jgi:hypothetical protein
VFLVISPSYGWSQRITSDTVHCTPPAGTFLGLKKDRPVFLLSELLDDFEADCTDRKLSGVNRIISHLKPVRAFFQDAGIEDIRGVP